MRTSLATSLLLHAGVVAAAWVAWTAVWPEASAHPGASLHYLAAPPEPDPPPPPPPAPPPPPCDLEPEMEIDAVEAVLLPEACVPDAPAPIALRDASAPVLQLRRALPKVHRTPPPPPPPPPAPAPAPPAAPAVVRTPAPVYRAPERRADRGDAPVYPLRARRLGLEGRLLLRVAVGADGRVETVDVLESSGHALLDEAALEAARTWLFVPARRDGKAVAGTIRVPVSFALR